MIRFPGAVGMAAGQLDGVLLAARRLFGVF
jgi:hypothetical protein